MTTFQIIMMIIGGFASIGLIIGGFGYLSSKFSKGSQQEKEDVVSSADKLVSFWKEQALDYKEMMAVKDSKNANLINELTEKVGILTGQLRSEKEQNDRLEKIFQNRNPEMVKFMEFMVNAIKDQADSHKAIIKILVDMDKKIA